MADFTAADVKKLRDLTGAGMMDCKKALTEADGDQDKAVEILRTKGIAKAAKRGAERTAANGLVVERDGTIVELNCETDFVAKGEDFQKLADDVLTAVIAAGATDRESALEAKLADGKTVAEAIEESSAVIGEKFELGRVAGFQGSVATYMHKRASDLPPQVGVLVEYTGDIDAARGAAMQIAAMRPQFLTRDEVPAETVENEKRIAEATAREEGKPEGALPKIVEGRVNGFFKDVVLLDQSSVQDSKKSVAQVLADSGTTVSRFVRIEVGG